MPCRAGAIGRRSASLDQTFLNRPAVERSPISSVSRATFLSRNPGRRYRIERELGRGGMARVYLAYDVKHCRDARLKSDRPELAASMGRERSCARSRSRRGSGIPNTFRSTTRRS